MEQASHTGPAGYVERVQAPAPALCVAHTRRALCITYNMPGLSPRPTGRTLGQVVGLCRLDPAHGLYL